MNLRKNIKVVVVLFWVISGVAKAGSDVESNNGSLGIVFPDNISIHPAEGYSNYVLSWPSAGSRLSNENGIDFNLQLSIQMNTDSEEYGLPGMVLENIENVLPVVVVRRRHVDENTIRINVPNLEEREISSFEKKPSCCCVT